MKQITNYHCIICDLIQYTKESLWIDKETYIQLQLEPPPTSGIFHKNCLEEYFEIYIGERIPEQDRNELRKKLEERLEEMKQETKYWVNYRRNNCPCATKQYTSTDEDEVTQDE